jgi:hypothetical protein
MSKIYTPREAAIAVLKKAEELYKASSLSKAEPIGKFGDKDAKRVTGHEKGVNLPVGDGTKSSAGMGVHHAQPGKRNPEEGLSHAKAQHKHVLGQMQSMPKPNIPEPMGKAEHQPHPGSTSAVPGYQAAAQAQSEAHLNTPQGDAERKVANAARMKGHLKLARFMGRMDAKKGMAKGETGHEKGVALAHGTDSTWSSDSSHPGPHGEGLISQGASKEGLAIREVGTKPVISDAKKASVGRMMEQSKIKPKLPG